MIQRVEQAADILKFRLRNPILGEDNFDIKMEISFLSPENEKIPSLYLIGTDSPKNVEIITNTESVIVASHAEVFLTMKLEVLEELLAGNAALATMFMIGEISVTGEEQKALLFSTLV